MGSIDIEGVELKPLKQIKDDRGSVMHWMRSDSAHYKSFGEVYFSTVNEGVVTAWKQHNEMTQHLVVPYGEVRFVICDLRESSRTYVQVEMVDIGPDNYNLIILSPKLWYGFKGLAPTFSLIANCTDLPFDENEVERRELDDPMFSYSWGDR